MKALEPRIIFIVEAPVSLKGAGKPRRFAELTQANGHLRDTAEISQGPEAGIIQVVPQANGSASGKLEKLGDHYFKEYFAFHPIDATELGIPGYETRFPLCSESSVCQEKSATQAALKELLSIPEKDLSKEEKLDYLLFKEWLKSRLLELSDENHKREPFLYGTNLVAAIFSHLVYPGDSKVEDLQNVIAKLFLFPKLVKQGMKNLTKAAPKLWVQREIEDLPASVEFIKDLRKAYGGALRASPNLKIRLELGIKTATEALESYLGFLREKLLPVAKGGYAAGKGRLAYSLKHLYYVKESPEELLEIAKMEIKETRKKMARLAREIDPLKSPGEILKKMESERPALEDFKKVYRGMTRQARQFLLDRDLMTFPKEDRLEVIPTPKFMEKEHPTAAYYNPKPFGSSRRGTFIFTLPPENLSSEEFHLRLRQHNDYSIRNSVVHEAYPGHHLQFARACEIKESRLRHLIGALMDNDIKVEGWGLYSERLMFEEGFANSKKDEMMRLEWLLHRQARLMIGIQLHTEALSREEAIQAFVKEVPGVSRSLAEAEIDFFTQHPTQPLSYVLGYREIMSLREELKGKLGDRFSLKAFHDAVLDTGNLPIGLVRDRIENKVRQAGKEGNTLGG